MIDVLWQNEMQFNINFKPVQTTDYLQTVEN